MLATLGGCGTPSSGGEAPCPDAGCPVPLPTLSALEVTGACPVVGGARLDVVLASATRGVAESDFVAADLLSPTAGDFRFETSTLAPLDGSAATPLTLTARQVAFQGPVGDPLVVLVLDQSASLVGLDAAAGTRDPARASDPAGARFAFFSQLIAALPPDTAVALVAFKGLFGQVDGRYATPTLDRQVMRAGLAALDGEEGGATPLARGLIDALEKVIELHPERTASVVLFTDGVEAGDTSNLPDRADPSDLAAALAAYRAAGVPVHVVQLAPPEAAGTPRERDRALADFACQTGGSWSLAEDPAALDAALETRLLRRLAGAWQVEAAAPLAPNVLLDVAVEALGARGGGRPWIYWGNQ